MNLKPKNIGKTVGSIGLTLTAILTACGVNNSIPMDCSLGERSNLDLSKPALVRSGGTDYEISRIPTTAGDPGYNLEVNGQRIEGRDINRAENHPLADGTTLTVFGTQVTDKGYFLEACIYTPKKDPTTESDKLI